MQSSETRLSYVPDDEAQQSKKKKDAKADDHKLDDADPKNALAQHRVNDVTDEEEVGVLVSYICPRLKVDPRSIGGNRLDSQPGDSSDASNMLLGTTNKLITDDKAAGPSKLKFAGSLVKSKLKEAAAKSQAEKLAADVSKLTNEFLLCVRVKAFDLSGTQGISVPYAGKKKSRTPAVGKARKKSRYICIVRTTNRPLMDRSYRTFDTTEKDENEEQAAAAKGEGNAAVEEDTGYDNMYMPDPEDDAILTSEKGAGKEIGEVLSTLMMVGKLKNRMIQAVKMKNELKPEDEISSFPSILCLSIHSDGTSPDIRKMMELDKLTAVQSLTAKDSGDDDTGNFVRLIFKGGDTIEIDWADLEGVSKVIKDDQQDDSQALRKETFLWSLLQIHAILCTSVVERTASYVPGKQGSSSTGNLLPPLTMRDIDRAELQYLSTVNAFLGESPILVALLDRQRNKGNDEKQYDEKTDGDEPEIEDMDETAYNMMMGHFSNRFTLFVSSEEQKYAADVLNSTPWLLEGKDKTPLANDVNGNRRSGTAQGMMDAAAAAERLAQLLQQRMRDLEAETCRRLIDWEDEKQFSLSGESKDAVGSDLSLDGEIPTARRSRTADNISLSSLFHTLDGLDYELSSMEKWLERKASHIEPLTEDCRDIEDENNQLEQQWKSFEVLKNQMKQILDSLKLDPELEEVLANPGNVMVYESSGSGIDVKKSENGVQLIHRAGTALKAAMDQAEKGGALHLRAVNEKVEEMSAKAQHFCSALALIVVTVMEQLAAEVVAASDHGKVSKTDTHAIIAKKIRDTQRKFQGSMLGYIKLIEVLALLKPKLLPAIRDAYSELVAEGILMKKRMKGYFQALPSRHSGELVSVTSGLEAYSAVTIRSSMGVAEIGTASMQPVNAADVEAALGEMLPVIAREAYFTAALFGLSSRHLDGREKKRNFESAKKSVDHSSQYFRYYVSRTCGIAPEMEGDDKKAQGDAMLSLVASIHLNENMGAYIDHEKKGGDHSLSLAYVRATILDLRKKVDRQWVNWIDEQIKWIRSNPNVPINGKRAGVFSSFSRFPSYLDHVMVCCKAGRKKDYTPNLANIKVVSYYLQKMANSLIASLHECAERETTDQQYGANVMRMENSYFFTQSIKQRGPEFTALFAKQISSASTICKQSTDAYLGWMIKREFKALHSLFSNISRIRRDVGDADVPIHVSRATFIKTLSKESSREVMKEKIGTIYSRMEKHLSESGGLLPVAWKALVKVLYEWFGRWEKLSSQCYKFVLEPSAVDVVRIAKAAGGSGATKTVTPTSDPAIAVTPITKSSRIGLLRSRVDAKDDEGEA